LRDPKDPKITLLTSSIMEIRKQSPSWLSFPADFPSLLADNVLLDLELNADPILEELSFEIADISQEIQKCGPNDRLLALLTEFYSEAGTELQSLQQLFVEWVAVTERTAEIFVGAGLEVDDPLMVLRTFCFSFQKAVQESTKTMTPNTSKRSGTSPSSEHRTNPKSPKLDPRTPDNADSSPRTYRRGAKILQPELTPLRIAYNQYKEVCSEGKVRRKTYKYLRHVVMQTDE